MMYGVKNRNLEWFIYGLFVIEILSKVVVINLVLEGEGILECEFGVNFFMLKRVNVI